MNRLATAWVLARRDGVRLGFTDHDREIEVDGVVCHPRSGLNAAAAEARLGMASDLGAVQGALDDDRLSTADIEAGALSGATLQTWRVSWSGDTPATLLRTQTVLAVTRDSRGRFEADLAGLSRGLDRVSGRVVSRLCGARFGDGDCGLDASTFPEGTTCPRSFAACQGFSNTLNFRGFPYLIGEDALLAGPEAGRVLDGGSRYRNGSNV